MEIGLTMQDKGVSGAGVIEEGAEMFCPSVKDFVLGLDEEDAYSLGCWMVSVGRRWFCWHSRTRVHC